MTYLVWCICCLNSASLEQESRRPRILALSLTKGLHEFFQLGTPLDLEENFVVSIRHFNVQMFAGGGIGGGFGRRAIGRVLAIVRHVGD